MAGEYGIGMGINQGLQYMQQGMQNSMNIDAARLKAQQDSERFNIEIQQSKMQMQELQNQIARRDTHDVLVGYEQTKDASILNTIKSNPIMSKMLEAKGITGFTNTSDISPEKLKSLGVDEGMINNPAKRIVIASKSDGTMVPMHMMSIYATTGFLPKLGEQKLKEIELKTKEQEGKISDIKYQDMTDYLANNPGATLSDYVNQFEMKKLKYQRETELMQANISGKYSVLKEQAKGSQFDAKKAGEVDTYTISKAINSDIDRFTNTIKEYDKNDTISIGDKKVSVYEAAKTYEDAQPQQLDTNFKNELRGKRNVILGADRILKKLDTMPEWDISTKATSEIERVVGDFTRSLSSDSSANTKVGVDTQSKLKEMAKNLPEKDRIYMESYVFPVVADYIKAMSGAAVSENERTAYVSNMTSGWMANKSAFKASLTGFKDSVNDSFGSMLDSTASSYPKTYLDLRIKDNKTQETSKNTNNSSTPSVKEGDTKEYNGKIYKVVNNKWVEQGVK